MSPMTLLVELQTRGLILEPRGDKLAFGPKDKVSPELRERIVKHKAELLRLLQPSSSTLADAYRRYWSTPESADRETFQVINKEIDRLERQAGIDEAWRILETEARAWHQNTRVCPFCRNPGELHFEGKKA